MNIPETKPAIPSPIGENKQRIDAREKVTGAAVFADDLQFGAGLLHARILRSPHPHALIKSIDTRKAAALPGVKAVVTGRDFPGYLGLYLQDRHIFCRDRVRYVGDPVVGIAAITEELAEKALAWIDVEYEPLEPVLEVEFGVSETAPLIHPRLGEYEVASFILPAPGTNIPTTLRSAKGMSTTPGRNALPSLSGNIVSPTSSMSPSNRTSPSPGLMRLVRSRCGVVLNLLSPNVT